jgi:type II secretory pathway pseudopilin PulG
MREEKNSTGIARFVRSGDRGFIMVALLIGMAVTAVWMSAMLPAWRQQAQRQREDDLIFRGEQYARAVALYAVKNNGALPATIDDLVQQRYLRKKWKDPITGEDFQLLGGAATSGQAGAGQVTAGSPGAAAQTGGQVSGGISGVYSGSTDTSIRIYNGAQQYNQWIFQYQTALQRMGQTAGPGAGRGGGRTDVVGGRRGAGQGDAGGRGGRGGGRGGTGGGGRGGGGTGGARGGGS